MAFRKVSLFLASLALVSGVSADESMFNANVGPSFFMFSDSGGTVDPLMSNDGLFCGARGEIEFTKPESYHLALVGVYAPGTLTSEHALDSSSDASRTIKATSKLWQLEARVGRHFKVSDVSAVVPYLGIGTYHAESSIDYKGMDDEQAKTSAAQLDWKYISVGALGHYQVSEMVKVGLGFKVLRHFSSSVDSQVGSFNDSQDLSSDYGYEVNLPVKILTGPASAWQLQVEPFLLKIDINRDVKVYGGRVSVQRSF